MTLRTTILSLVATTLLGLGAGSTARGGDTPEPTARNVGQRMPDFTLKTLAGDPVHLYGYAREKKKAVVLVFTGTACPVGDLYMPRLAELAKVYEPKGVAFVAINANAHESADDVARHAKEHGITFPVLKDPKNLVADMALVERTPEVVLLDGRATIRYRGAIDDQYAVGSRKANPTKHFLTDALDAVLDGKKVEVASTEVLGCPIDRVEPQIQAPKGQRVRGPKGEVAEAWETIEKKAGPVEVGKVTYAADVASILQAKCQSCHRPGQSAPFNLLSYDDARRWSGAIAEVIDDRRMPPWHADPRHGTFANDRSLTPKQRALMTAWVDQGTPLGDPAKVPAPIKFPEGWTAGAPDLVIEMPEPYTVPAQGVIDYVFVRVPTNFKEDRWVSVAQALPGDRSVVHHIVVYLDAKNGQRRGENHLCGYAPGDMPSIYPAGTAKKIPAGSDLIFQLHYTPNGKVHTDRSKLGLTFAKAPVQHEAHTRGIANNKFTIDPGDSNSQVKSSLTIQKDIHLLAFMPHMHLRGKDFKYTLVPKDGPPEVLLSVPAYDFGWQSYYTLAAPRLLKAGDRIDCVAHFDNSKENPANPDPTKSVSWGDQTFQEMMIGYIDYYDAETIDAGGKVARTDSPR
jgi:peroxiredoxin